MKYLKLIILFFLISFNYIAQNITMPDGFKIINYFLIDDEI